MLSRSHAFKDHEEHKKKTGFLQSNYLSDFIEFISIILTVITWDGLLNWSYPEDEGGDYRNGITSWWRFHQKYQITCEY